MTNPYQPPDSNIEVHEVTGKTRWKVFFWILLVLELLTLASMFFDLRESLLEPVLELVVYSLVLLGVFGYAFDKRFFMQSFWKGFFPLVIAYDAYFIFIKEEWEFVTSAEMYITLAIFATIFIPLITFQYMALYRYGFKAHEIWGTPV